ncbi:unnamed protein product, partial [Polarella glacialis]
AAASAFVSSWPEARQCRRTAPAHQSLRAHVDRSTAGQPAGAEVAAQGSASASARLGLALFAG